jgi:hypothetical protein
MISDENNYFLMIQDFDNSTIVDVRNYITSDPFIYPSYYKISKFDYENLKKKYRFPLDMYYICTNEQILNLLGLYELVI